MPAQTLKHTRAQVTGYPEDRKWCRELLALIFAKFPRPEGDLEQVTGNLCFAGTPLQRSESHVSEKPTRTKPSGMRFVDERVGDDALTENRIFSRNYRTP